MGYDPVRRIYTPDMVPPEQQGWTDFGEDQPIDMAPAAGAFKQRFMSGPRNGAGDMTNMPTSDALPEMTGGGNAGGGSPLKGKGIKSL